MKLVILNFSHKFIPMAIFRFSLSTKHSHTDMTQTLIRQAWKCCTKAVLFSLWIENKDSHLNTNILTKASADILGVFLSSRKIHHGPKFSFTTASDLQFNVAVCLEIVSPEASQSKFRESTNRCFESTSALTPPLKACFIKIAGWEFIGWESKRNRTRTWAILLCL